MANFEQAFEKTIRDEGGYQLTNIPGDRGGQTYAGIARKPNPDWSGWQYIDRKDFGSATPLVREFYKANFWDRVRGDDITNQAIAETIFNFAVNTGVRIASKLAQLIVGTTPDGAIGPKTVERLNICTTEKFLPAYTLAKIQRYVNICMKDRSQSKFLLGWCRRSLEGLK
jgi:lysozyme family protein